MKRRDSYVQQKVLYIQKLREFEQMSKGPAARELVDRIVTMFQEDVVYHRADYRLRNLPTEQRQALEVIVKAWSGPHLKLSERFERQQEAASYMLATLVCEY